MEGVAEKIFATVLIALAEARDGLTRDGISQVTGIKIQTVCPTVVALRRDGRIIESDKRRPTRSGRSAYVLYVNGAQPA